VRSPTASRWGAAPRAADRVPAAVEEEDPAPGIEAVGHQRGVVAEEIAPPEARPLQEVDLRHDEVAERRRLAGRGPLEGVAAERALMVASGTTASQDGQVFVGASPSGSRPSRSTSCSSEPWSSVEVPKSSTMQSVLTTPGCSSGIDRAQAAADHLDHGRLVGTRPQQHDAGGGGWSQPSVSTATLTTTRDRPAA
jgi:hypothetical protein